VYRQYPPLTPPTKKVNSLAADQMHMAATIGVGIGQAVRSQIATGKARNTESSNAAKSRKYATDISRMRSGLYRRSDGDIGKIYSSCVHILTFVSQAIRSVLRIKPLRMRNAGKLFADSIPIQWSVFARTRIISQNCPVRTSVNKNPFAPSSNSCKCTGHASSFRVCFDILARSAKSVFCWNCL